MTLECVGKKSIALHIIISLSKIYYAAISYIE